MFPLRLAFSWWHFWSKIADSQPSFYYICFILCLQTTCIIFHETSGRAFSIWLYLTAPSTMLFMQLVQWVCPSVWLVSPRHTCSRCSESARLCGWEVPDIRAAGATESKRAACHLLLIHAVEWVHLEHIVISKRQSTQYTALQSYEILKTDRVVRVGQRGGIGSCCVIAMKFPLAVLKIFWN